MTTFRIVTDIAAPVEECFDLSRSIDVHLESMAASRERAVGGVTSGLIGPDQDVSWEAHHLGIRWRMTSRITSFERPHRFVDEMVRGPFAYFRHEHQFQENNGGTRMTDTIEARMGLGWFGPALDVIAVIYLRRLITIRNATIQQCAEHG